MQSTSTHRGDIFWFMVRENLKECIRCSTHRGYIPAYGKKKSEECIRCSTHRGYVQAYGKKKSEECIRSSTHRGYIPAYGKRESKGMHPVFYP